MQSFQKDSTGKSDRPKTPLKASPKHPQSWTHWGDLNSVTINWFPDFWIEWIFLSAILFLLSRKYWFIIDFPCSELLKYIFSSWKVLFSLHVAVCQVKKVKKRSKNINNHEVSLPFAPSTKNTPITISKIQSSTPKRSE